MADITGIPDIGNLIMNGAIGGIALIVLNRILNSFITATSKDRDSQNQAINTLAGLIGTISSQIDLNRQVVDKNNDLIEHFIELFQSNTAQTIKRIDEAEENLSSKVMETQSSLNRAVDLINQNTALNKTIDASTNANKENISLLMSNLDSYRREVIPGVVVYDSSGKAIASNEIAISMLKRDPSVDDDNSDIILADGMVLPKDRWPVNVVIRDKKSASPVVVGIYNPVTQGRDWVSIEAYPVLDDTGSVIKIVSFIRNVGRMNSHAGDVKWFGNDTKEVVQ